jgi:glutathione peroxidase
LQPAGGAEGVVAGRIVPRQALAVPWQIAAGRSLSMVDRICYSCVPLASCGKSSEPSMKNSQVVGSLAVLCGVMSVGPAEAATGCPPLLDHRFQSLQGKPVDLCQYRGKVLLVVNTASYCGYTEQYKGLQALYDRYQARGLVVLGFPANDFGKQEPGSNAEVADFCERTYKVKFPMLEKTSVVGEQVNPVHEALFKATGERPKWNFHKYLVAADGKTVKSFASNVAPESPQILQAIDKLISEK